jgi:hypothetical protein
MALRIVTADERLAKAGAKTTMAIFGPSGVGKTSLLKTLPPEETLCIDLEAGMKSVQHWPGDSIPVRTFTDALDIGCLAGGVNPAADPSSFFSEGHYRHLSETYPDLVRMIAGTRPLRKGTRRGSCSAKRDAWCARRRSCGGRSRFSR